jgi:hypothetical protein
MTDVWEFTSSIGAERRSNLEAVKSFDDIAAEIGAAMEVLCCHYDSCDRAQGFRRVVYTVKVPRPLFDLFFNSRHGYRAAYFRSPHEGLAANSYALRTLSPALLASPATISCPKDPDFVRDSLMSESAKVWLAEAGKGIHGCKGCEGEWTHPADDPAHIRNGRWERDPHSHALWGRTAPFLTKLKIMGAHLNDARDEFVPASKRRRALDIHERGWS